MKTISTVVAVAICFGMVLPGIARDSGDISFSGKWFLTYDISDKSEPDHQFILKRGYFTSQKKMTENFSFRFTQDVAVDREGDGIGDIEIRLKYGYLKYIRANFLGITNAYTEIGVVHRPWIDFEEKINHYRVQGTLFLERNGILRSADYGALVGGQFGSLADTTYLKNVNKSNPGKYGSFAFGIYNGGGYEEIEYNNNKYVEGRLTLRPFPAKLPGVQVSFLGGYGKGNIAASPDFSFSSVFLSFETAAMAVTGQYFNGVGDLLGTSLDASGNALDKNGFSFFAEHALWPQSLKLFARYDNVKTENSPDDIERQRYIGGLSYYFLKNSKFLVDYEHYTDSTPGKDDINVLEFALEVNF